MTRNATEALPSRFRFATDDSARGNDEAAATLQARLRGIALVGIATLLAFVVLMTMRLSQLSGDARASMEAGRVAVILIIVPLAFLAWWLRKSRPRSMTRLRGLEVAM